ncbi:cytochrome P450 [Favolaschia claudopus]|uniref:Cytochrome P450 n=1 Tax=Favolaschia claudopus TaxID=2862362 RepID=A0AAV9Z8R5_9AGAR
MTFVVVVLLALIFAGLVWRINKRRSTVRDIVGPPSSSWILGNMEQFVLPPRFGEYESAWRKRYGPVYRFKACFGEDRLMISDPAALQALVQSSDFVPTPRADALTCALCGPRNILSQVGQSHARLRAGLTPGFTAAATRRYQPIFEKVALTISEKLNAYEGKSTNMCSLLSVAAFDAIAEAVFGNSTESLDPEFVDVNLKVAHMATGRSKGTIIVEGILDYLPKELCRKIINLPSKGLDLLRTQTRLATSEGHRIVQEKLDAAQQGLERGNDVFDLLLFPENSNTKESLNAEDIIGQMSFLMLAGGETTSNTLAFGLVELAKDVELQEKLRAEIHAAFSARPVSLAYDSLPLLNAFIKETLRLYPVIPTAERMVVADTIIPLSDPITLRNGRSIQQIPVRKGQIVVIGIGSYQMLESIWGADADVFRPSRWLDGTVHRGEAIGPYASLLTFLGGIRTCLGWRIAVLEMQVFLCELLAKFSFALAPDHVLGIQHATILQPVDSAGEKSVEMIVSRIS